MSHSTAFERNLPPRGAVENALRDTRQAVFWLEDAGDETRYPTLTADTTADLVVVGGGYCGLWTAIRAKQRDPGARVVLLEAKTVGWAASGRNGGFCEASLTHGEGNGEARWPDEMSVLDRLGMENLDAIERSVAELGLDCEFERNGSLDVAVEEHQVEWLREGDGVFLDQEAIRAQVNSPTYLAGSWNRRTSALVHPAKLAKELARAAVSLGVDVFEHSAVAGLSSDTRGGSGSARLSSRVSVTTDRATVRAAQIALATNVFPSLVGRDRLMTVPVYDYVLMTEPLTPSQLASIGWQGRQGIGDLANQFHYYRLTADNRILWGGYDAVYHFGRRVDPSYEERSATFSKLAAHFFSTFPQLDGVRFSHRWAGAIDTSTQFCAFFGLSHGGRVASAAGFTGLGVASTHFAADVMLDRLAGLDTERATLSMVTKRPLPFPPEPVAFLGVQATRWALNRADHSRGKRNLLLRTLDAVGLGFDS
ncbi:NAD(P)/FAD-dependent oxidoreductase [Frondihabitans australicus]|uniref:Glycine/D-amino acid oxidase-like deaminating enzyme n=1 Tax=Frondihabitans australicus TaxID=386892 RepID=A0A495IDJ2_9MICO|nr:FAD-dependent oxidoreductase [Frondihabitans australicus]RKR73538.1 glycine/D-amino acid oxidase-like deaminating enzyme [Frondihabitans australicus]